MGQLRKPLFLAATALVGVVVLLETGSGLLNRLGPLSGRGPADLEAVKAELLKAGLSEGEANASLDRLRSGAPPPGMATLDMALIDGLILYTLALMGVSLIVPGHVHGKYQGGVTLAVSLIVIIISALAIVAAVFLLVLMLTLLMAFPFGTLVYMVKWGFFNRVGAGVTLSLIMALKLGSAVCLVLAQPRFLQNKGLVLIVATSLLANVVISFLHGLVPILLVSVTDALAAIIVSVLAVSWAVFLFVTSVRSVVRAVA
jgi:hypothetical protein